MANNDELIDRALVIQSILMRLAPGGVVDDFRMIVTALRSANQRIAELEREISSLTNLVLAADEAMTGLERDRERLDWLLDDDFARYDPRRKEYRDRIDSREAIDAAMAAEKGGE